MKTDEFLTELKNIINEDLQKGQTVLDFGEILDEANKTDIKIELNSDYYVGSVDEWNDMVNFEDEGDFSYEKGSTEGFKSAYKDLLKSGALYQKGNDLYLKEGAQILFTTNYTENDIVFKYSMPGNSFGFGQVVAFILAGNKKLQWPTMDLWLEDIDAKIV